MLRKQHRLLVLMAVLSGFLGGIIPGLFFQQLPVSAELPISKERWAELQKQWRESEQRELAYQDGLKVIKAEGFVLVDKNGKVRAKLVTQSNGTPRLEMFDSSGQPMIEVVAHDYDKNKAGFLGPEIRIGRPGDYFSSITHNSVTVFGPRSTKDDQGMVSVGFDVQDLHNIGYPTGSILLSQGPNRIKMTSHPTVSEALHGVSGMGLYFTKENDKTPTIGLNQNNEGYPSLRLWDDKGNVRGILALSPMRTKDGVIKNGEDMVGLTLSTKNDSEFWGAYLTSDTPWLFPAQIREIEWQVLQLQADHGETEFGENGIMINYYLGDESIETGVIHCDLAYLSNVSASSVDKTENYITKVFSGLKKLNPWLKFQIHRHEA